MSDKYGVPAIISFFIPGLGQMVKGEIWKGVGLMLGALISGALAIVLIGFILYPIIWFYSIYDAYNHVPSSDK